MYLSINLCVYSLLLSTALYFVVMIKHRIIQHILLRNGSYVEVPCDKILTDIDDGFFIYIHWNRVLYFPNLRKRVFLCIYRGKAYYALTAMTFNLRFEAKKYAMLTDEPIFNEG